MIIIFTITGQFVWILIDIMKKIKDFNAPDQPNFSLSFWWKRNGLYSTISIILSGLVGVLGFYGGLYDGMAYSQAYVDAAKNGFLLDAMIKTIFKS